MAGLTDRELEILKLRKEGKTQAEIAQKLKISQPAVSSFERNAQKKIADAKELLELLKKLGLLAIGLLFLPFLAGQANAANPGHLASSVGAGTFEAGDFVFQNSLTVNGSTFFVNSVSGRVGVGTLTPNTALEVNGTFRIANSTNGTLFMVRTATNGTPFVGIGIVTPNNALSVNGSINASGTINQGAGLDIAEQFGTADISMGAGDIVAIVDRDNVKKSTQADASLIIGVVSTSPGFTMSKQGLTNPQFIALAGRVPVKIAGPVQKGDYITVSNAPGVGVVATEPGFVVGRALEDSAGGTVYILVNPGYFSPRVDTAGNLIGGLANRKFEPPDNEQLSGTATVTGSTQGDTLQADVITPTQGKDVVVILG